MNDDQRDRSLTVMIPRAKYRSAPQSPQNYKGGMSTFATEEHKLINYLDNGPGAPGNRKQSITSAKDCKEADLQGPRTPVTPTGALVSAGFQVQLNFFTLKINFDNVHTRDVCIMKFLIIKGISDGNSSRGRRLHSGPLVRRDHCGASDESAEKRRPSGRP